MCRADRSRRQRLRNILEEEEKDRVPDPHPVGSRSILGVNRGCGPRIRGVTSDWRVDREYPQCLFPFVLRFSCGLPSHRLLVPPLPVGTSVRPPAPRGRFKVTLQSDSSFSAVGVYPRSILAEIPAATCFHPRELSRRFSPWRSSSASVSVASESNHLVFKEA